MRRRIWRKSRKMSLSQGLYIWMLCTLVWVNAASKLPTNVKQWITLDIYMTCYYRLLEYLLQYLLVVLFRKANYLIMIFVGQSSSNLLIAELTMNVTHRAKNLFQNLDTVALILTFRIMITSLQQTMIRHLLNSMKLTNYWFRKRRILMIGWQSISLESFRKILFLLTKANS